MIDFEECTREWERDGDWRIAPDDCPYMVAGHRVMVGRGATIGTRARIGTWTSIGDRASIGTGASIGDRASIGVEARIGDWAKIGTGVSTGTGVRIGDEARIFAWATFVADLGYADGYRKCLVTVNDVYYIDAGCRHLTMLDALAHWSNHAYDRRATMAQLAYAQALIDIRKVVDA